MSKSRTYHISAALTYLLFVVIASANAYMAKYGQQIQGTFFTLKVDTITAVYSGLASGVIIVILDLISMLHKSAAKLWKKIKYLTTFLLLILGFIVFADVDTGGLKGEAGQVCFLAGALFTFCSYKIVWHIAQALTTHSSLKIEKM